MARLPRVYAVVDQQTVDLLDEMLISWESIAHNGFSRLLRHISMSRAMSGSRRELR